MILKIYSEPNCEPVSLQEFKDHLRLASGSFSDNLTTIQSIVPGAHAVTVEYAKLGIHADILGYSAVVILDAGAFTAGGTVDAKIQEADVVGTWTDWNLLTGGAFTQITASTVIRIQKIAYTGSKQFIRVVAKISGGEGTLCSFGISIAKYASDATEDELLTTLITTARQHVETITKRALITQTWDAFLDEFPDKPFIKLPFGEFKSIVTDGFTYTDSAGVVYKMAVTSDYLADINSEPGRIVLPYDVSWPSFTPYPVNPVAIRFVCGYGDTSATVPAGIRTAIKMMAADLNENRETQIIGQTLIKNKAAENLLGPFTILEF